MGGECSAHLREVYKILVGKTEGKNHFQDLDIDRRVILKFTLKK
jgi:hypothetical protein